MDHRCNGTTSSSCTSSRLPAGSHAIARTSKKSSNASSVHSAARPCKSGQWWLYVPTIGMLSSVCHHDQASNKHACCRASVDGRVVEDTRQRDKPVVYLFGGRPFTGGLCQGTEEALSTMRVGRLDCECMHACVWGWVKLCSWHHIAKLEAAAQTGACQAGCEHVSHHLLATS